MPHLVRMPAQDGQQLPRAPVPEPRRLVQRGRDHPLAVRAEGNREDAILVSGEDGQQPAGGRVPEARRVIRVIAPRNQPRPVRAEKHRTDMGRVAAQHGDFFAALAIPEVNGVGTDGGRGRNPLAIRTVSQVADRLRMRAQDGKLAARDGVAQVDVLPGTHCHPLAIGAKGDRTVPSCHFARTAISLPVVASHNRLVPAPAHSIARLQSEEAIRLPSELYATRGLRSKLGGATSALRRASLSARRRIPEADGLVVAAGGNLLAVRTVRHGCRRSRVPAEDGVEPCRWPRRTGKPRYGRSSRRRSAGPTGSGRAT